MELYITKHQRSAAGIYIHYDVQYLNKIYNNNYNNNMLLHICYQYYYSVQFKKKNRY